MGKRVQLVLVFICMIFLSACPGPGDSPAGDGSVVKWLEQVQRVHRSVDVDLDRGELDKARTSLKKLLNTKAPDGVDHGVLSSVLQDVYFRLAGVEIRQSQWDVALRWVKRGLSLGCHDDVFCANLYIAKGHALEKSGDDAGAIKSFNKALQINERLLDDLLGEGK